MHWSFKDNSDREKTFEIKESVFNRGNGVLFEINLQKKKKKESIDVPQWQSRENTPGSGNKDNEDWILFLINRKQFSLAYFLWTGVHWHNFICMEGVVCNSYQC